MTTSSVKIHGGVPTLFVNGNPIVNEAYMTYYTHKAAYRDFSQNGFLLYSCPVFFGGQTINALSQIPPFKPGIFDENVPDFSVFDQDIQDILTSCPDAFIFPRVNLSLPPAWEMSHPQELCDTAPMGECRSCFSSDLWASETKRLIGLFIDHIAQSDFADRIVGYQLAGGNTEEWFSFDQKGSIGPRSREKFAAFSACQGLEGTEAEYAAFLSLTVCDRILEFAHYLKEKTGRRKVVGAFYGYTFECPNPASCHHALGRMLESEDIDFLCSPVSYMDLRPVGQDHPYMLPIDSVKLHGKLYFAENDTRTHLTGAPNDMPYYSAGVWQGPPKNVTLEIMKMHFARALTHGHAMWWFDMWGGWYADPDYMAFLRASHKLQKQAQDLPRQSIAQVAVFTDEKSLCLCHENSPLTGAESLCYNLRRQLGLAGAPYDLYLLTDQEAVLHRYQACIYLVPVMTAQIRNAADAARDAGCHVLVLTPKQASITPADLRHFYQNAGVTLMADRDVVFYACESFLFLHAPETAVYHLTLPKGLFLTDLEENPVGQTLTLTGQTSHLFRIRHI